MIDEVTMNLLKLAAVLCGILALQGIFGCLEERRRNKRKQDGMGGQDGNG